jgi:hypothetical protein
LRKVCLIALLSSAQAFSCLAVPESHNRSESIESGGELPAEVRGWMKDGFETTASRNRAL